MALPDGYRIETVRGKLDDTTGNQLVEFWTGHGVLGAEAARQRLEEVVCVLYDGNGQVAGVNSVTPEVIPHLGNRRLWRYRMFVPAIGNDTSIVEAMIGSAQAALEAEYRGGPDEPLGLCLLLPGGEMVRRMPEAVWPATGLIYAGYTKDGSQLRVGWFEEARI